MSAKPVRKLDRVGEFMESLLGDVNIERRVTDE